MMLCKNCNKTVSFGGLRVNEVRVEVDPWCLVTLSGPIYLTCGECGRDLMRADASSAWYCFNSFDTISEDDENESKYEAIEAPELEAIEEVDGKKRPFQQFDGKKKKYGVRATILVRRTHPSDDAEERYLETLAVLNSERSVQTDAVVEPDAFKECG